MVSKGKILAVDDTPASLRLLTELLENEGYEVRSALSGELALLSATSNPPELILLDIRMPEIDGFEVCRHLKSQPETHDIPVIFISSLSETDDKVQGFQLGAVDFVVKPYQKEELLARVSTHLQVVRLNNHLEELLAERTAELLKSEVKLRRSLIEFITALATTIEMRDPYTAGHQRRVAELSLAIAKELQLPESQIEGINLASVVHDIGKIRIPAEILSKPAPLDKLELGFIKRHTQTGYDILKTIDFPWPIAQTVLQHHERLDGSGYPSGLTGSAILLEARIIGVADVVEAMISHRPYRAGLGVIAALAEIVKYRECCFDADVVDACIKLFKQNHFAFSSSNWTPILIAKKIDDSW